MTVASLEEQAGRARDWWRALQPLDLEGRRVPGDRAALARLRRCASPLEAASEPATIALYRKLGLDHPERDLPRVAALAGVLAHVRARRPRSARASTRTSAGRRTAGRAAQAAALQAADGHPRAGRDDDRLPARRSHPRQRGERTRSRPADAGLGRAGLGDRVRTRFAFDYHGAAFAAPGVESTDSADVSHSTKD